MFFFSSRYLTLLEDQKDFPCLSDENRYVISLPPLTNAERSKVNICSITNFLSNQILFCQLKLSPSSESIFIEITSGNSMDICRRVMDSLLREMIKLQLGKKTNEENIRQVLTLQQTRVVDDKGQLKNTFPSRTDLLWEEVSQGKILIERLTSDK